MSNISEVSTGAIDHSFERLHTFYQVSCSVGDLESAADALKVYYESLGLPEKTLERLVLKLQHVFRGNATQSADVMIGVLLGLAMAEYERDQEA